MLVTQLFNCLQFVLILNLLRTILLFNNHLYRNVVSVRNCSKVKRVLYRGGYHNKILKMSCSHINPGPNLPFIRPQESIFEPFTL